jgi:hypothetical protein
MSDVKRRNAAAKFAVEWAGRGSERSECQPFWLALLRNVYSVANPESYIRFEDAVRLDNTSFIDGIIAETNVLIEQKGLGKDLRAKIKQSDGKLLTPFQQAKRYAAELPYSKRPRWIVTCNFSEFLVYDMENPQGEPESILLENLADEYHRLNFLVDSASANIKREEKISLEAGELVGKLYDAILKQYHDPDSPETLCSLNMLCVRLVFCLYAEDCGLFGTRTQFRDYLKSFAAKDVRRALLDLFEVLNQIESSRDKYMDETLAAFPYVNGGLFDEENIEIPRFTEEIVNILVCDAAGGFNWSDISPTIFGAVFESTLNPTTRRSGGMHYTSILNIHKVIDPLFLDELKAEFEEIKAKKQTNIRQTALKAFQEKLSGLTFLDPAAGSGNFLTETYISLRRLENAVLKLLFDDGQIRFDTGNIIKVSIGQFYGFEINDFAVTVAKTALWIAESQMMKETEDIVAKELDFLPLKSYANITECNALRVDWEELVPKDELDFIMGNPPFVGKGEEQSKEQKEDLIVVFKNQKGIGNLDYVSGWYKKAIDMVSNTSTRTAFVSTNSISQGEQPPLLWKERMNYVKIDFAYRTFKWDNEGKGKAAVHCVIIGFSSHSVNSERMIFDSESKVKASNISPYLLNSPSLLIESRTLPLCAVSKFDFGSMPNDAKGLLSNYTAEQKRDIVKKYPETEKWFKRIVGADEFLKNIERWCLWLVDTSPAERTSSLFLKEVLKKVKEKRENSPRQQTKGLAKTPYLFGEIRQPTNKYLLIPCHSSERRDYIPIDFMSPDVIASNATLVAENITLYHFGILTSSVHMEWMRTVCGRIKSDYRYSNKIVYNNFPWADVSDKQKSAIEKLAQAVLDARALFPDSSLADLYDPLAMPLELAKAHKALDREVLRLYGFSVGSGEAEVVSGLMERYQKLTGGVER